MYERLEVITNALLIVGETPLWDSANNMLYYIDINGHCLRSLDYNNGKIKDSIFPQMIGSIAFTQKGTLIAAMERGIYEVDMDGKMKALYETDSLKGARFNDGKVGPDNCFYVGTCGDNFSGAFYKFDHDCNLHMLFDGVGSSNGLDWDSSGKQLYYNDTHTGKTDVFDFDKERGALQNRRSIYQYDKSTGLPDGMAIDQEGKLWVALWNGWKLIRIDPDSGDLLEEIAFPVANVTCCTFAGDNLQELIVTTSCHNAIYKEQPLAGALFRIKVDVPGYLQRRFEY